MVIIYLPTMPSLLSFQCTFKGEREIILWNNGCGTMIACSRCGHWHTDPEETVGKKLSCTEVKQYWSKIRNEHMIRYGHVARITTDEAGSWICFDCKRLL